MLARNDGAVRTLNNQLADIWAFLASGRGNLSTVLTTLPPALDDVARFIRNNRDILRTDVSRLARTTDILVRQRAALTEVADVAPLALGNLQNTYNANSGTLDVRPVIAPELLGDGLDPRALLCNLLANQPGVPNVLANAPPSDAVTQLARASVVCGAIPGNGTRAPTPLGLSLAPFQNILNPLSQRPTLNALTPVPAGPAPATGGATAAQQQPPSTPPTP